MQEGNAYIHSQSLTWETIPFFGPAVSCPEINDETLGKISKTFSSVMQKSPFKIFLKKY